jgi:hypothetical protein
MEEWTKATITAGSLKRSGRGLGERSATAVFDLYVATVGAYRSYRVSQSQGFVFVCDSDKDTDPPMQYYALAQTINAA